MRSLLDCARPRQGCATVSLPRTVTRTFDSAKTPFIYSRFRLNQPRIDRIFVEMSKWANVVAACFAILAIMYLFVLPAVNPPVSTGAQWLSVHAPIPTSDATALVLA